MSKRLVLLALLAVVGFVSGQALAGLTQTPTIEDTPLDLLESEETQPEVVWTARTEDTLAEEFTNIAIDELLRITRVEDIDLQVGAAEVLGELGTDRATATLGVILYENPNPEVRMVAARVLGELGSGMALETIAVAMAFEHDPAVRVAQMDALAQAMPQETDELPTGVLVELAQQGDDADLVLAAAE